MQGLEGQKSQLQKDSLKTQSKCLYIQLFSFHTNLSSMGGRLTPSTLFGTEGRQSGRMIREVWDSVFLMEETGLELARPPCKGYRAKGRRLLRRRRMGVSRSSPFWN